MTPAAVRGLDLMRDVDSELHSTSSVELAEHFFRFRDDYPARPCWVHFQTTDVHEPNEPVPPFAGQFVSKEEQHSRALGRAPVQARPANSSARPGEWEDTLLVIAADHGHPAGTFARFGRGLFEPQPGGCRARSSTPTAAEPPLDPVQLEQRRAHGYLR
jgi:hypothetical protein